MSIYIGLWNGREDVETEYRCKLSEDIEILLAWYGSDRGGWGGQSFVLYRQHGKLYEVNAAHCSCYGLEGQWEPEETTVKALRMREEWGEEDDGDKAYRELQIILDCLTGEG